MYVCVCVSVTPSVDSPTGQSPQRIFTVDSLKDADLRRDVLFGVSMMNNHIYGPKSPKTSILGAWIGISKFNSDLCITLTWNYLTQLRPATETSWVVSYGGKTIPRWRTAAILKIDISPYIREKSSDFHETLYTAADFELDEHHVIKNEKVALDRLRVRQNVFLV